MNRNTKIHFKGQSYDALAMDLNSAEYKALPMSLQQRVKMVQNFQKFIDKAKAAKKETKEDTNNGVRPEKI